MNTLGPILLRPDNLTPPTRTPWGGHKIRAIKAGLLTPSEDVVGESWEISVEPHFPSVCDGTDSTLHDWLRSNPTALGREARRGTALLVKLLDAAQNLSVQVHPSDDYPGLKPNQAGKPESWYVVDRSEGAGLYFGLGPGVTREQIAAALTSGADVSQLLHFLPVEPGDFLVIDAGTVHAVGAGVTLVEPQHVAPGRHGVTYRFWDWNRRFDEHGKQDPGGRPRQLHVEDALDVTDWESPRAEELLATARFRAGPADRHGAPTILGLCGGQSAALHCKHLVVSRLTGTGAIALGAADVLRGLTVLEGTVTFCTGLVVGRGRSAVIPAGFAGELMLDGAHSLLSSC